MASNMTAAEIAKHYEDAALNALEMSDEYLEPGNSSQWVAHVYAAQAQTYATLALLHKEVAR